MKDLSDRFQRSITRLRRAADAIDALSRDGIVSSSGVTDANYSAYAAANATRYRIIAENNTKYQKALRRLAELVNSPEATEDATQGS